MSKFVSVATMRAIVAPRRLRSAVQRQFLERARHENDGEGRAVVVDQSPFDQGRSRILTTNKIDVAVTRQTTAGADVAAPIAAESTCDGPDKWRKRRMSLEPINEMMSRARAEGYAVGYFESWSIDSLYGVIDAAEAMSSPVIIGFNGEFLSHPGRLTRENIALYGALGRAAAAAAKVPCGFIFNECAQDGWTKAAVDAGFNLVMPADAAAPLDDYSRRVAEITALAHSRSVAVEAEIGELPSGVPDERRHDGSQTNADQAQKFVEATGVDLLAVSVGNIHIALNGRFGLDLDRLGAIAKAVEIPLVLHGGSGIATDALQAAIRIGVAKVNYGTYLKQRYLAAVREALLAPEPNPHALLGLGGKGDLLVAGRNAVREAVLQRMPLLGSVGKA